MTYFFVLKKTLLVISEIKMNFICITIYKFKFLSCHRSCLTWQLWNACHRFANPVLEHLPIPSKGIRTLRKHYYRIFIKFNVNVITITRNTRKPTRNTRIAHSIYLKNTATCFPICSYEKCLCNMDKNKISICILKTGKLFKEHKEQRNLFYIPS